MKYDHVARMVFNQPWYIREREGRILAQRVLERIDGLRLTDDELLERIQAAQAAQGPRANGKRQAGPVAVIPIYGVIMPRATLLTLFSGGSTVQGIREQFRAALGDDAVKSILFDVDSPGGAVDGIEELATEIRAARGRKPMVAISNTLMASAAYYLACQADEVVVSPSSMTGSIGVFMEHVEFSRMDEAMGVTATVIRRPAAKHEVNEVEPLSDDARAHLQETIDDYYGQFTSAVAKGRGVTVAAVKAGYGEGRALTARRAVDAGLADRTGTFDETRDRLEAGKGPIPGRAAAVEDLEQILAASASGAVSGDGTGQTWVYEPAVEIEDTTDEEPAERDAPDVELEAKAALALARAKVRR